MFGILGAIACRWASELKHVLGVDDALDVMNVHGVGGFVGTLLTGVFAEKGMAALDGLNRDMRGGWVDGNWAQVGIQVGVVPKMKDFEGWK